MRKLVPLSLLVFFTASGCGGAAEPNQAGSSTLPEDPEGLYDDGQEEEMPMSDDTGMPDERPAPSGPVSAQIQVRLGTEDSDAALQVVNANGDVVFEGHGGQTFTAPAGSYTVQASITDESVMIDTPTHEEDVILEPGDEEPVTVEIHIPRAQIRLNVTRNGRPLRHPRVTLISERTEEEVATFTAGDRHIPITPGRYQARVQTGGGEFTVTGLTFMDGATQNIPVNFTEQ